MNCMLARAYSRIGVEIWKWIPEYEERYKVSNLGRLKSYACSKYVDDYPGHFIKPRDDNGYLVVVLTNQKGKKACRGVHRLVLLAFEGSPPEGKPQCAHADGNKRNNSLHNLRWASAKENAQDKMRHGTNYSPRCGSTRKVDSTDSKYDPYLGAYIPTTKAELKNRNV